MKAFNGDLVKLFNISIEDSRNEVDYVTLNNAAMQVGYIVHPKACNRATKQFIRSISGNVNSTLLFLHTSAIFSLISLFAATPPATMTFFIFFSSYNSHNKKEPKRNKSISK